MMYQKLMANVFDIIFISYSESNADDNWQALQARFPQAKRVHGIKGIDAAHTKAMELSQTPFFFVVDGDNQICSDFHFDTEGLNPREDTLYVWRAENPVNGLVYGYGAIKLYNKTLLQRKSSGSFVDLATSVSTHYHVVNKVASQTHFYNTPEEAWRGGFREAAKLAGQLIADPSQTQAAERLKAWCEVSKGVDNSGWVIDGARAGRNFAKNNVNELYRINDFEWLSTRFKARLNEKAQK